MDICWWMKPIIGNEETVDERQKNFLTEAEIEKFLKSSRYGRHGVRNFNRGWRGGNAPNAVIGQTSTLVATAEELLSNNSCC